MAINFDAAAIFPNLVLDVLIERLKLLDSKVTVVNRGIRKLDPDLTIGLYPESWQPVSDSEEFQGGLLGQRSVSTLNEYFFQIHTLGKSADMIKGQSRHSVLCRSVRDVVEFDAPLRVALESLPGVVLLGRTEKFKNLKALSQVYFPLEEPSTGFVNIGALRCKITTETQIG